MNALLLTVVGESTLNEEILSSWVSRGLHLNAQGILTKDAQSTKVDRTYQLIAGL